MLATTSSSRVTSRSSHQWSRVTVSGCPGAATGRTSLTPPGSAPVSSADPSRATGRNARAVVSRRASATRSPPLGPANSATASPSGVAPSARAVRAPSGSPSSSSHGSSLQLAPSQRSTPLAPAGASSTPVRPRSGAPSSFGSSTTAIGVTAPAGAANGSVPGGAGSSRNRPSDVRASTAARGALPPMRTSSAAAPEGVVSPACSASPPATASVEADPDPSSMRHPPIGSALPSRSSGAAARRHAAARSSPAIVPWSRSVGAASSRPGGVTSWPE